MNIALPKLETIQQFSRAGKPAVIHKTGTPLATEGAFRSLWMDVTPAMATDWLRNNFRNRPISEDVVAAYARDMINGVWRPTHQGIAFNDRDELIDGQHRLRGIILANVTVRMMVTFGLPAEIAGSEMTTMDCVDRGRTRSLSDQLKIQHNLKDGTHIAQIASALSGLCCERVRRLSVGQALEIYREFQAPMDFVMEARSKKPGLKSAGVLAGFAFAMIHEDGSQLPLPVLPMQMFHALNSGEDVEKFPTIKLLREFLTGTDASLILASMNRGVAELTVQALYLEGCQSRVDKLEMSLDGVNHFRTAQPQRIAKIAAMLALPKVSQERTEATEVRPAVMPAAPSTPAATSKSRPTLDTIFARVEHACKISKFIMTGRGSDSEISDARQVFTIMARGAGYTDEMVAQALHRPVGWITEWNVPVNALSKKLAKAVADVRAKL